MTTFAKVAAVVVGGLFAYGLYESWREKKLWYAVAPGDTTSMMVEPGREQIDIPPGGMFEPGYTPAVTEW